MDILHAVIAIIASSAVGGLAAAGLTWLAKTWLSERLKQSIQHEYATQLEAHKATLKSEMDVNLIEAQARLTSENAVAIERFKSDLQVAAAERQLRYKHVYDREAEAIAVTYENLRELTSRVSMYVAVIETPAMGSRGERWQAVLTAFVEFTTKFRLHRLYLPRGIADSVDAFATHLSDKAAEFTVTIGPNQEYDLEAVKNWPKLDNYMKQEAPRLLDELETEFRRRLGQEH